MKRVDLHVRLGEELFKKLNKLRKNLEKQSHLEISMNDFINMLLLKGSK